MKCSYYFVIASFLFFHNALSAKSKIIILNDENWRQCLTGEWMIKFYAPWCPACRQNEPQFKEFSEWSEEMNIKVAVVDITKEPGLSGRFVVTALPTFYHAKDGDFRRYVNDRSSAAMEEFIENNLWKNMEPISWLRHPNTIQMSLMSFLFRTSVFMKSIHESLTETYGLSTWMSYALFGVGTLVTGLLLGMILVCLIDFIYPSKAQSPSQQPTASSQKSDRDYSQKEDDKEESEEFTEQEESDGGNESNGNHSQDEQLSQKSSRSSQEWETIQDAEVVQSEMRKRHVEKEAGDQTGDEPKPE